jgi:hypothetical protein
MPADGVSSIALERAGRKGVTRVSWTCERECDQFPRSEQQQRDDDCQHRVTEDLPAPARHQSNRSFVGIGGRSIDPLAAAFAVSA